MRLGEGLLVRCRAQGRALWRMIGVREDHDEAEVVFAPGLCRGTDVWITRQQPEHSEWRATTIPYAFSVGSHAAQACCQIRT
jgi:hypothetical protein